MINTKTVTTPAPDLTLARVMRTTEYFTLAFGTAVGVGWVLVMDDWLGRGGPMGGMLGFLIGGIILLPIASIYSRMVAQMPDAGSEVAYTAQVFPPSVSFTTGWFMTLAYLIVCPWEAVAIGKIVAYLVPDLDSIPLYQIGDKPVYRTPANAVVFGGLLTVVGAVLGEAILIPITEVGSFAVAVGWMATCVSFLKGAGRPAGDASGTGASLSAGVGVIVCLGLIVMKLLPFVPSHFQTFEYVALGLWVLLGGITFWVEKAKG